MPELPWTLYYQRGSWTSKNRRHRVIVQTTIAFCLVMLGLVILSEVLYCVPRSLLEQYDKPRAMHTNIVVGSDGKVHKYDRSSPLLFVSGVNLSGTDHLRDVLNGHPDIRCSSERHFIPKLLRMKSNWYKSRNETIRLREAGVSKRVIDAAIGAFSLELMVRSGEPAKYICTEDFHSIKYADQLSTMFPQSKFILVVRDPLHYVHSKMRDSNAIFNETLFNEILSKWNKEMQELTTACYNIAVWETKRCLILHHELLYLRPQLIFRLVLEFIFGKTNYPHPDIPDVMHSKLKPGRNEELIEWVEYVPKRAVRSIGKKYDMVDTLGYGHVGHPPNYILLQWMG